MKLVHTAAVVLFGSTIVACWRPGGGAAPPAQEPQQSSTTHVNAAAWEEEASPKVGKAQLSEPRVDDEALEADKSAERERRHSDGKRYGGSFK